MESAFNQIDVNGDGLITREEIKEAFERMEIEISDNELIQLMDRIDVDRSNEISISEFSQMTALKLHLLAQGLAEARNTTIMAKPKPKVNRSSMSELWRRVSTRNSSGDGGERRVVSATSLIAMLAKPSRNSSVEGRPSGRLSQGDGSSWSIRKSSLKYNLPIHSAQAKVNGRWRKIGVAASFAGETPIDSPAESEASPVTKAPPS